MRAPALQGIVRRRILLNFRVEPEVIQCQLPTPFRPQLVEGRAIAGVCLIRLEQLQPSGLPAILGVSSENAAHRVAVTWTDGSGVERPGVYIPRRDTGSPLNPLLGGRFFPGEHQRARFHVREDARAIDLAMRTLDGAADVRLKAHATDTLPPGSVLGTLEAASRFFAAGSVGYSATGDGPRPDGLELRTSAWHIEPLDVELAESQYFAAGARYPAGSVDLDSALIMRNISHEWRAVPEPTTSARCV